MKKLSTVYYFIINPLEMAKMDASSTQSASQKTAKRSPSILVTDIRKNQTKAPFAGHKMAKQRDERVSNLVKPIRSNSNSNSKYSSISVSNLTSNISEIPSSRQRQPPARLSNPRVPQYTRNLPTRTSKSTQKLVLIPDNATPEADKQDSQEHSTTDNIFQEIYSRTRAEQMTKEQREQEYPRVTAYLIAEGFNLKLTSKFLAKYHGVLPRLYDEVLYIPYSLPLLPGENGYRVQSNTSLKMQKGIELMEDFINASEERDHNYEFYSGQDGEINHGKELSNSPSNNNLNDFDPSEPQFFVSQTDERSNSENSNSESPLVDIETGRETENAGKPKPKRRKSLLPDLTKLAEMFILDYGVVVFWNFPETHEKNILADLVFAKIELDEFDDDDDDDEEEEETDTETEDENLSIFSKNENTALLDNDEGNDNDGDIETVQPTLAIKPVPEHDIETEEFHFEYNKEVLTPRIYNDMITLKSGDHSIKLTMSHAIAQSTKLSLFESKMSNILNSISRLPKVLALTGELQNYTTKRLLTKTGKLFQLRSEVNLSSNVLDTPEYFWSIEPGLHPLYTAIREYLEIEQRVEVINDRCKVFLDFFDIISDSLAEKKTTKITKVLIFAIGLSVTVSLLEIFFRYLIISKLTSYIL